MQKRILSVVITLFTAMAAFSQAPRLVLFEEFTGENCGPCAFTNPYMQQLISTYPSDVLWLRYQCNIPTPGTIYYQNTSDVNSRMSYYHVNSAPWGQQDGAMWDSSLISNWGNLPITYCADTNTLDIDTGYLVAEHAVTSPFSIAVSYQLSAGADSFYTTVTVTGTESYKVSVAGKLKLQVAMIENLSFNSPPGDNGETDFPDVVRKMYPGPAGTVMPDSSYNGLVQTFHFSGKLPSYIYDKSQVRFAAFIQDDNNKHVQQAGVSNYSLVAFDGKAVNVQGSFVACDTPYLPSFNITNTGTQTFTSAHISINLDGAAYSNFNWTGSLAPGTTETVALPGIDAITGNHILTAVISQPDNATDLNPMNDTTTFIYGVPSAAAGTPLTEGFENASNPSWLIENPTGGAYTWVRSTPGDNSSYSFYLNFYYIGYGVINNLYGPTTDFTGVAMPKMKFSHANAQYDFGANGGGLSTDSLYINVSTDCGATWINVYANGGNSLATVASSQSPYSPAQADWVNDTVDLSAAANSAHVLIQFNAVSGNGNNLYIDNINIFDPNATVGVKTITNINSLSLFPDPAVDLLNVKVQLAQTANISFNVTDALGRVVINGPAEIEDAGNNTLVINTAKLQSGVYFLSVMNGAERTSKMFAVVH